MTGIHEFDYDAEVIIAAHAYPGWAWAGAGEKPLAFRSEETNYPVTGNNSLAARWASG